MYVDLNLCESHKHSCVESYKYSFIARMHPQKDRLYIYSKLFFVYLFGSRIPCSPFPDGRAHAWLKAIQHLIRVFLRIPFLFSFRVYIPIKFFFNACPLSPKMAKENMNRSFLRNYSVRTYFGGLFVK